MKKLFIVIAVTGAFISCTNKASDKKFQVSGTIINNPAIPNEQNEEVMSTASGSIMDTLKGMMSGAGAASVLNLFNQNNSEDVTNHPVTQNVSSNLITTLMNKFGLDSNKAGGIASAIKNLARRAGKFMRLRWPSGAGSQYRKLLRFY